MRRFSPLTRHWLDRFLPNLCLLCGHHCAPPLPICAACERELPYLSPSCERCALPLTNSRHHQEAGIRWCGRCLYKPPPFDRAVAAFAFQYPIDRLIRSYKDHGRLAAGTLLSALLAEQLHQTYSTMEPPDIIIPVPLHWRRLLGRGFNQAGLCAGQLGKQLGLPVASLCKRRKYTPTQRGANRSERHRNLQGAFQVCATVKNQHIAVVDDVVTTSTTVSEVARTLKRAGATQVDIWALARTPDPA